MKEGAKETAEVRRRFQRPLNAKTCAIWFSLAGLIGGVCLFDPLACYTGAFFGAIVGFVAARRINQFERPKQRQGPMIWLAGRSRRFWIVAAMMTPLLYMASIGPAMGIYMYTPALPGKEVAFKTYVAPADFVYWRMPFVVQDVMHAWARLWNPPKK